MELKWRDMTREIIFKAKRIDNGEWVEGCLVIDHSRSNLFEYRMQPVESGVLYAPPINPETICQYTGLTDKNGNRIWENDIANANSRDRIWKNAIANTDSNVCVQIKFGKYSDGFTTWKYHQGFYMAFSDKGRDFYRNELGYWHNKIEIVGNIFDNPELVKEE